MPWGSRYQRGAHRAFGEEIAQEPRDPESDVERVGRVPGSEHHGEDLLAQYLAHGETLEVGDRSPTPMHLADAVVVQAK